MPENLALFCIKSSSQHGGTDQKLTYDMYDVIITSFI